MDTKVKGCSAESLQQAAQLIREGQLVAFPTETVYGLGGNGFDREAALAIFAAKSRPADNPLIEHIVSWEMLDELVTRVPEKARAAMEAFWPGPLTCVLPAADKVPRTVTAGLNTVAVRWPDHPVAQALIREAGYPLRRPVPMLRENPVPPVRRMYLRTWRGGSP